MDENKRKKGGISGFVMLALIIGAMVGFNYWGNQKTAEKTIETFKNDKSYQVITNRDKSYNGFYTLTKLDDKGNNTWDGLLICAKKDKIVAATLVDYMTLNEAKKKYHLDNSIKNADEFYYKQIMAFENEYENRWSNKSDIQFDNLCGGLELISHPNEIIGVRNTISYGAIIDGAPFTRENIDMQKDYDILKDMGLIPGYDKDSNEIWLSKLVKNKNSIYHKGYKLRKYKNDSDVEKNCKITDGNIFSYLNETFNAGLSEE